MKNLFLITLFAALFFTGCNKEDSLDSIATTVELCASIEHESTRAAFDEEGNFLWTVNDAIGVTTTASKTFAKMALKEGGAGNSTATFTANYMAGTPEGYAVYPYNQGHSIDGTTLTYNFPTSYDYTIQDHSYFVSDGTGNSFNPPMWAEISNGSVGFKHLGGVLCIKIADLPAGENQTLTVTTTNQITGEFTTDLSATTPALETSASEENNVVTFNYSNDTKSDRVFYVPVPIGTYEKITIAFKDNDEDVFVYFDNVEITRRKLKRLTIGDCSIEGGEATEVSDIAAANDALEDGKKDITIESATTGTISIPEQTSTDTEVAIEIGNIESGSEITIEDANGSTQSIQTLNLTIPESMTGSLTINLPNTTVYLNGVQYENVTALTAANTLIVGAGVTVKNLIVKGGNVRVSSTGAITSISRDAENADAKTIIYYEEGAVIPSSLGDKILAIKGDEDKWNGESYYAPNYDETTKTYSIKNAYELAWVAVTVNEGNNLKECTIFLENDIDLNNKNWTPIGFNQNDEAGNETCFSGIFDGNDHTISNLKIDLTDKGGVGLFGAVHNATFKNFTLNNVDVKAIESEDDPANSSGAEGKSNYIVGGHIGAVAGYDVAPGSISFENVHIKGLIKIEGETRAAQGQRIGGIFGGRSSSKVNFNNVSVNGSNGSYIKGYCSTAGIMGQNQGVGTFTDVHTDIDIHAVTFGAGGIIGIALRGSTFTNCSSAGDITLDASKTQLSSYSANYPYRVGGIAGCWSEGGKTGVLTLVSCSFSGELTSIDKDNNSPEAFDYAGYVGRGYGLNGCQGSTVTIDGVSYVQAFNEAANSGVYYINGELIINSAANLKVFAGKVNSGEEYFEGITVKLGADIDLTNEEWTPIGSAALDHGFMGNFDGNGKTIKNLSITNITTDSDGYVYAGLFGVTEGTDINTQNYIKDLTIENVNIYTQGHIVAAAIAYPYYTIVENITVQGDISITGGDYTAGILAYTRRCVDAKDLEIKGNTGSSITGASTVGGVISDIQMNGGLTANYSNFSASGLTITATSNVGGISGIISAQTLDGATVNNVEISCAEGNKTIGIVSGALGSTSIVKNISVSNVSGATNNIGAMYNTGNPAYCHGPYEADKKYYFVPEVTVSGSAEIDKMREALIDGAYIKVNGSSILANPVDGACFVHTNKSIIDGEGGSYLWNYDGGTPLIKTSGGTLKNLLIYQTQKAIVVVGQKSKVVLDNVEVSKDWNVNHAIHADEGNGDGLEATNCKFYALISYAAALGNVKFTDSTFGANEKGNKTKGINAYASTEFVDCAFEEGCTVYLSDNGATVTFENCTYKGEAITADNLSEVVTGNTQNASVK